MLFVCVLAVGCSKKNTPAPVVPTTQSPVTGSSDRAKADPPSTIDRGAPQSPPVRSSFGPIYYAYDSAELDDRARAELGALGDYMMSHASATVRISGHTDERGTTEYNLALGDRRANAAKAYLTRLGIASERVSTISYGEERPAAEGSEERSWSQNRRCELELADR